MSKYIHYSRYTGEDLGIGAEDLLQALASLVSIQSPSRGAKARLRPFHLRSSIHTPLKFDELSLGCE